MPLRGSNPTRASIIRVLEKLSIIPIFTRVGTVLPAMLRHTTIVKVFPAGRASVTVLTLAEFF
jgi:hypothetical protein